MTITKAELFDRCWSWLQYKMDRFDIPKLSGVTGTLETPEGAHIQVLEHAATELSYLTAVVGVNPSVNKHGDLYQSRAQWCATLYHEGDVPRAFIVCSFPNFQIYALRLRRVDDGPADIRKAARGGRFCQIPLVNLLHRKQAQGVVLGFWLDDQALAVYRQHYEGQQHFLKTYQHSHEYSLTHQCILADAWADPNWCPQLSVLPQNGLDRDLVSAR